ncbi:MAG: hypothetical protein M1357_01860 [Candidatus Marsarchaeota archaeon]|nr:hypothetical protein [Candidatus Marsarchaeota archaeon]
MTANKCPECGSVLVTDNFGQSVCQNCGLIVDEVRFSPSEEHSEKFYEVNSRLYSNLTSQVVPGSFVSTGSSKSLAISNVRSLGKGSTYLRGVELIRQVCTGLRLNKNVEKRSIYLFGLALNGIKRNVQITVSSIVGGVILYALREEGIPISFKEVFNYIKFRGKRITTSKMIRAYREVVGIVGKEPPRNSPQAFAVRIVNLLSEQISTDSVQRELIIKNLLDKASKCIQLVPTQLSIGKNPYVLAAGAVRFTLIKTGLDKVLGITSDAQFSVITHVTEYSLKEYVRVFEGLSISFDAH